MFMKGLEKIAQMSPAKAIPFPHGIVDKAIKKYNTDTLARHSGVRTKVDSGKIKFLEWLSKERK